MKNNFAPIMVVSAIVLCLIFSFSLIMPSFAQDNNISDLKQQIKLLQQRVEELEAEKAPGVNQKKDDHKPVVFGLRSTRSWDPFEEISQMQQAMNHMFQESFNWGGDSSKGMFRSNVFYDDQFGLKEENDKYVIEIDMADMDKSKIEIQVNDRLLSVKGERSEESTKEQKTRYLSSKSFGTFMRSIVLPDDADITKMRTEYKKNKLIIDLPKKKA